MKKQRINLIPPSHAAPPAVSVDQFILLGIFAGIIACGIHFYFGTLTLNRLSAELATVQIQQSDLDVKIQEAQSLMTQSTVANEQNKLVQQVIGSKPNWGDAFKELSLIIPRETWLSQLVIKNNGGQIGTSIKGETSSQYYMTEFLSSLEKSEFFNNVLMNSSKMNSDIIPPIYSFEFATPGLDSIGAAKSQAAK